MGEIIQSPGNTNVLAGAIRKTLFGAMAVSSLMTMGSMSSYAAVVTCTPSDVGSPQAGDTVECDGAFIGRTDVGGAVDDLTVVFGGNDSASSVTHADSEVGEAASGLVITGGSGTINVTNNGMLSSGDAGVTTATYSGLVDQDPYRDGVQRWIPIHDGGKYDQTKQYDDFGFPNIYYVADQFEPVDLQINDLITDNASSLRVQGEGAAVVQNNGIIVTGNGSEASKISWDYCYTAKQYASHGSWNQQDWTDAEGGCVDFKGDNMVGEYTLEGSRAVGISVEVLEGADVTQAGSVTGGDRSVGVDVKSTAGDVVIHNTVDGNITVGDAARGIRVSTGETTGSENRYVPHLGGYYDVALGDGNVIVINDGVITAGDALSWDSSSMIDGIGEEIAFGIAATNPSGDLIDITNNGTINVGTGFRELANSQVVGIIAHNVSDVATSDGLVDLGDIVITNAGTINGVNNAVGIKARSMNDVNITNSGSINLGGFHSTGMMGIAYYGDSVVTNTGDIVIEGGDEELASLGMIATIQSITGNFVLQGNVVATNSGNISVAGRDAVGMWAESASLVPVAEVGPTSGKIILHNTEEGVISVGDSAQAGMYGMSATEHELIAINDGLVKTGDSQLAPGAIEAYSFEIVSGIFLRNTAAKSERTSFAVENNGTIETGIASRGIVVAQYSGVDAPTQIVNNGTIQMGQGVSAETYNPDHPRNLYSYGVQIKSGGSSNLIQNNGLITSIDANGDAGDFAVGINALSAITATEDWYLWDETGTSGELVEDFISAQIENNGSIVLGDHSRGIHAISPSSMIVNNGDITVGNGTEYSGFRAVNYYSSYRGAGIAVGNGDLGRYSRTNQAEVHNAGTITVGDYADGVVVNIGRTHLEFFAPYVPVGPGLPSPGLPSIGSLSVEPAPDYPFGDAAYSVSDVTIVNTGDVIGGKAAGGLVGNAYIASQIQNDGNISMGDGGRGIGALAVGASYYSFANTAYNETRPDGSVCTEYWGCFDTIGHSVAGDALAINNGDISVGDSFSTVDNQGNEVFITAKGMDVFGNTANAVNNGTVTTGNDAMGIQARADMLNGQFLDSEFVFEANVTNNGDVTVGHNSQGLYAAGQVGNIINNGSVTSGDFSFGALAIGARASINNTGSITVGAGSTGVMAYGDVAYVYNSGNIVSGSESTGVVANGASMNLVYNQAIMDADGVVRSGEIMARENGFAIQTSDAQSFVVNNGLISGSVSTGAGDDTFYNNGMLELNNASVDLGTGNDALINRGEITFTGNSTISAGFMQVEGGAITSLNGAAGDTLVVENNVEFIGADESNYSGFMAVEIDGQGQSDQIQVLGSLVADKSIALVLQPVSQSIGESNSGTILSVSGTLDADFEVAASLGAFSDTVLDSNVEVDSFGNVSVTWTQGLNAFGATAAALPGATANWWHSSLGTTEQRLGQTLRNEGSNLGVYMRGWHEEGTSSLTAQTGQNVGSAQMHSAAELGINYRMDMGSTALIVGTELSSGTSNFTPSDFQAGGATQMTGIGFNATLISDEGAYIDMGYKVGSSQVSMHAQGVSEEGASINRLAKGDGTASGLNLELGMPLALDSGLTFKPQIQLSRVTMSLPTLTSDDAIYEADYGDVNSTRARAGLSMLKTFTSNEGQVTPYFTVSALHELESSSTFSLNNQQVETEIGGTSMRYDLGISGRTANWTINGNLGVRDGDKYSGGYTLNLSAQYNW